MSAVFTGGDLLIATISLIDPNFQHAVVLLCRHEELEGTYGLVLNRTLMAPPELLEQMPFIGAHLLWGGPVQTNALQVLHPYGEEVEDAVPVLPGLWIGGDFEILNAGLASGKLDPGRCRFFLGYAGWRENQLQKEYEADTWIKVRGNSDLIINTEPERLWSEAVKTYGSGKSLFEYFPENPSFN